MKLIYAIINEDDTESVVEELNKADYKVTKLSTTGGFLKRGNTTLMICTEDENLKDVTSRIERVCGKRHKVEYDVPCMNYSAGAIGSYFPSWYGGTKKKSKWAVQLSSLWTSAITKKYNWQKEACASFSIPSQLLISRLRSYASASADTKAK